MTAPEGSSVARAAGAVVVGVAAHLIDVEVQLNPGIPGTQIVGLPDTAVAESRDRARAAVLSSGGQWPRNRITVGLSPADLPKRGSMLDLPIALGILAADGVVPPSAAAGVVAVGELGLDGAVRPVRGVVAVVRELHMKGLRHILVPVENLAEAGLVPGVDAVGVRSLAEAVRVLRGVDDGVRGSAEPQPPTPEAACDLRDVRGQTEARRALEIAAAGGHHMAMSGPPGVGKTLLAQCLAGILPDLDERTALDVTAVHSVEGLLAGGGLVVRPPFVAPHHTATRTALFGGGSAGSVRPGAISVAHGGVLFLDEAGEFPASVLDALRQPLETGVAVVHRAGISIELPARVQLVIATNPCPCGHAGSARCICTPMALRKYAARISGPLLDRIDIRVEVLTPTRAELRSADEPESSHVVAERVAAARSRAAARWAGQPWLLNADAPGPWLRRHAPAERRAMLELDEHVEKGRLSLRGADRALRLAWTVADMSMAELPDRTHVARALELRGDGMSWAA